MRVAKASHDFVRSVNVEIKSIWDEALVTSERRLGKMRLFHWQIASEEKVFELS